MGLIWDVFVTGASGNLLSGPRNVSLCDVARLIAFIILLVFTRPNGRTALKRFEKRTFTRILIGLVFPRLAVNRLHSFLVTNTGNGWRRKRHHAVNRLHSFLVTNTGKV